MGEVGEEGQPSQDSVSAPMATGGTYNARSRAAKKIASEKVGKG